MKITEENGSVRVSEIEYFSVEQTFDCGQCFRFTQEENGVSGFALGRAVTIRQLSESEIEIIPCTKNEFENEWMEYLGLNEDYGAIRADLTRNRQNDVSLAESMERGKGIRILRQPKWETLCSFIISQNNNIPRIKKIIEAMAERCGERIELPDAMLAKVTEGRSLHAFPTSAALAELGVDGLFELRTGFRAKYIYDAALKDISGEIDYELLRSADSTAECAEHLCRIKGVGPKVASCALLFGFGRLDSFPIDVWIKKVISKYFSADGESFSPEALGRYAGVAQQYLFYYERYLAEEDR